MYRYVWKIILNYDVSEEDFIKFWKESSQVLQEYPGAKGTHIHSVRNEPRSFLAMAEWGSMAERDAMQADIDAGTSERAQRYLAYSKNEEWGVVTFQIGAQELDLVLPQE